MECNEVKTPKYQTRKSPAFHAGKCPGQTKQGKDGVYESKEDARGVYKWIKVGITRKAPKVDNNHTAGLKALAKKHPRVKDVGFLWKNPLNPKSTGIRWTVRDLEIFRKFQKAFVKS
jgi:hypothetical protein